MKDEISSLTVEKCQLTVYSAIDNAHSRHKKYTKSDGKHSGLK